MPSAASALGTMLLLDDLFPGRAQPPQLQVFKRELDWMLKMQRSDGAVYHKVTPLNFGGFDKGSDNIGGQLFVFDASTPDAAVFAAIAAEASRVYRPFDAAYADRLLARRKSRGSGCKTTRSQSCPRRRRVPAATSIARWQPALLGRG